MGVLGGNSPGQRDRATSLQGNVLDHATSDTDLSPSQSALGLGRLRLGDEEGGRKGCLQGSWANKIPSPRAHEVTARSHSSPAHTNIVGNMESPQVWDRVGPCTCPMAEREVVHSGTC